MTTKKNYGPWTEALRDAILGGAQADGDPPPGERPSYIPPEVAEEWQTLLADLIWWFKGYEALANRRQRNLMPDVGRLRAMREDVLRVADGREARALGPSF